METQNWLLKQAATQPNQIAIDDGNERLSFAELKKQVEVLVGKIDHLNPGSRVGILATNTLMSYKLSLAIMCSGRTIVWLNWRLAGEELERQIKDSGLQLCLVENSLWRSGMTDPFKSYSAFLITSADPGELIPVFKSNWVASIMYTSGTTGRPKGVLQTFGNHFYSAVSSALNLGLSSADKWLCVAPIFHISGFSIIMRGLIYGMTVRLVEKFRAEELERILANETVTIMSVVPFMLKKLIQQQNKTNTHYNSAFRCMLLGGGTIDRETLEACLQRSIPVVQCYGMTETCSQIVALRSADALLKLGSVGQPLFSTQLKLSKDGEILLKTPALTPGYLNLPDKLPSKMIDGWYRTGDIGHLDKEGYLYIDGRADEMLISGGENIFPQEVEQIYQRYPQINEVAVVGQNDSVWGQVPVAFVVSDRRLSPTKLINYGYEHLARYKVPQHYIFVSELPKNASGKIRRFMLREKLNNE
ncbi:MULTISPECIES: o-succinylbenzoate--CoA ligase [Limosilactobacillus]|uniref:2-succinylbenzoate--CoA ligase n=1 Tax=Limosilactobacillus reuteri TaxID=1598 RepID=A0AAW6JFL5_LIMRT|nr:MULTISPECIES: o-succinylbenzoate--CoA ligase [Limosilactobacillus]MCC4478697.1 o-succinylbenzoate--CoA ligase [Limosilactobacillus reuteri]MCC4480910.1 o-succinylbenzoate--CoA ligase [Limosilactobacillus reuteri]MCC4489606.1 o-succinylbenzoate--CoA ligase [Limosilactobacillus reuteri]MCC4494248.1 o-succinylbenzoate--CoA ligase [Limosilactobacillus reuteri]MCC4494468.1 o-succinylbenzoate--CoA ligase [Limosilactobacillus reuteri]